MALRNRGLSLIEVVIVMALIAVLMALSLPMLSNANAEARSVVCKQNLADIGNAIANYTRDAKHLPTITPLPPHEQGISLPELVTPWLQTPNALYCPSDETELSHVLSTSYRWSASFNAMPVDDLDDAVGQPILADREAFHLGADLPSNELVLQRSEHRYQFAVRGANGPAMNPDAAGAGADPQPTDHTPTTGTATAQSHAGTDDVSYVDESEVETERNTNSDNKEKNSHNDFKSEPFGPSHQQTSTRPGTAR